MIGKPASIFEKSILRFEQGENIKYVQSQLGHSSSRVTFNIYARLIKSVNQGAPTRL
jgi:integrase